MDWTEIGHRVYWSHHLKNVPPADFCFCLGFGQLVPNELRNQFCHTLVVHESDLPRGKGWSPLTWQILEGRKRIAVTLFEGVDRVDSGPIYAQCWIELEGHELIDDIRAAQGKAASTLCRWFVDHYPESAEQARIQSGEESFYKLRRPVDSKLDPSKSIADGTI